MPQIFIKDILNSRLNMQITKVCQSWQDVVPGSVFVAIKGAKFDGHDFLDKAIERGASLLVVSDKSKVKNYPSVVVDNTRAELSRLAALFHGEPSKKMQMVGITGTNGKTTTNWMIYHMLIKLGKDAARLGTLGFESTVGGEVITREGDLTTPDSLSIHSDLNSAWEKGARAAVLEISSHALEQHRADDLHLDAAVYSNLTRDHLDYHKEMQSYFNAKARIFSLLSRSSKKNKSAVINLDCDYGNSMLDFAKKQGLDSIAYGKTDKADLIIKDFSQDLTGSRLVFEIYGKAYGLESKFIGYHNAENAGAAVAACLALGFEAQHVLDAFQAIPQVPGRLESVGTNEIGIFVDYAHTPDALENVARALKPLVKRDLWILFGCGGDRDKGKRPQMAEVSAKYADKVVVTSDNPRTEDPEDIIKDILAGGVRVEFKETDRRVAISRTIKAAKAGDIVLIAGKGHENYQIIGTEKKHFSDVEEVARALDLQ